MKKFLPALFAFSIVASAANAETQGHYVGLNLVNTYQKGYQESSDSDNNSWGITYGYAFNFDRLFIAPEIFYDHNDSENNNHDVYKFEYDYSYGIKANLGYDITDDLAGYVSLGHAEIRNQTTAAPLRGRGSNEYLIVGFGGRYSINDSFDLSASFELGKLGKSDDIFNSTDGANSFIRVTKFGLIYNF